MRNAPMRFGGMSLSHNPSKLTVTDAAGVMRLSSPGSSPDSRYIARRPRIIKGEGELYGGDCLSQYEALHEMYMLGQRGVLALPGMAPMYAYLSELGMTAEPTDDVLGYTFTFTETGGEATAVSPETSVTAGSGDSLWDVAYRYGIDIETLVALNPHIPHIGRLTAGAEVRLC